jgi:sugar-specific transcriptional regulator TrmB
MTCERHEEVIEILDDHDDRIKYLELADSETKVELRNLIKQVEKLVHTIEKMFSNAWKTLIGVAGVGMGFILWYIQSL